MPSAIYISCITGTYPEQDIIQILGKPIFHQPNINEKQQVVLQVQTMSAAEIVSGAVSGAGRLPFPTGAPGICVCCIEMSPTDYSKFYFG